MTEKLQALGIQLSNSVFVPSVKATTKKDVLAELTDQLVSGGKIAAADRDTVLAALVDREDKMSTGMQYGLAIPHAKTDVVDKLITLVGISPEGVDFSSLDGIPTKIFIATLSPRADTNSHIRFLVEISRQLSNVRIREALVGAKTAEEMIDIICERTPE